MRKGLEGLQSTPWATYISQATHSTVVDFISLRAHSSKTSGAAAVTAMWP